MLVIAFRYRAFYPPARMGDGGEGGREVVGVSLAIG